MTRCVIYTRVSTEEQGRDGASLSVQEQQCRRHAAREGWAIVAEEQDIQSGLEVARPGYQRALDLARAHGADVVLCWRLDRLGRDDAEAIAKLKELAHLGVRVVSASEGEQSPFLQKMMFLLANEESRRISQRVRPAMRKRAEEGRWLTTPPFGYRMVDRQLEPREPYAGIVREMFRRSAAGESTHRIAIWLNTVQVGDGQPLRSPRGRTFTVVFVRNVLRSRSYIGEVAYGLRRHSKIDGRGPRPAEEHLCVPGQHEPIVDRETFDRVQAIRDVEAARKHPQRQRQRFLLTGLVVCGQCGRALCGQYRDYTGKYAGKSWAYRCPDRSHGQIGGHTLEAFVRGEVGRLPVRPDAPDLVAAHLRQQAEGPDRRADLRAARATQEARRKRLTGFLADGTLDPADYRAQIEEIGRATATIDADLAALGPEPDTAATIAAARAWVETRGTIAAVLEEATLEEQAAIVGAAVRFVTVERGKQTAITWHPWAAALLDAAAPAPM